VSKLPVRLTVVLAICAIWACDGERAQREVDNPVVIETRTGDVRLDEIAFSLARRYPELALPLDDEIASQGLDLFIRDLVIAELYRVTEERIDDVLLGQLAMGERLAEMPERERTLWRNEVRRRLAVQAFLMRDVLEASRVSDEIVGGYYRDHEEDYKQETIYRIRFVQTDERDRAEALRSALKESKDPFSRVAAAFAVNEGHLAAVPMTLEEMPEPFAKAVRRLQPGQYSRIIPIKQGESELFYVLYLEAVDDTYLAPVEEIFFHIREELERQRAVEIFEGKVKRLRELVPIEVHHDRLPFQYRVPAPDDEV